LEWIEDKDDKILSLLRRGATNTKNWQSKGKIQQNKTYKSNGYKLNTMDGRRRGGASPHLHCSSNNDYDNNYLQKIFRY